MMEINECKKCKHSTVYAQGRYCNKIERFIPKDEEDLQCGEFEEKGK